MNADALVKMAGPPAGPARSPGLSADKRKAIEEFEALLLGDVLKNLRGSMGASWLGEEATAGNDAIVEMAEQQLVKTMASQDALGMLRLLGDRI